MTPGSLVPDLVTVLGFATLVIAAVAAYRKPVIGALVVLGLFLLTWAPRDAVLLQVQVGSVTVRAADIVAASLLLLGGIGAFKGRLPKPVALPLSLLVVLVLVHALRGVQAYGLQPAINSSREWIYFVAAALFASSVAIPWDDRFLALIALGGGVVAAVAFAGMVSEGVRSAGQYVLVRGSPVDARFVTAAGGLLALQGVIASIGARRLSPRLRLAAVALGGTAVVLLQHRTVWVAGAVSLLIVYWGWSSRTLVRSREASYAVTGSAFLLTPILLLLASRSHVARGSVAEALASHSTFQWRTQSWTDLIQQHSSFHDLALGVPAATSWERIVGSQATALAPHNVYVESLLRFGIAGPACLAMLVIGIAICVRGQQRIPMYLLGALVLTELLFGITYQLGLIDGLILGAVCRFAPGTVCSPARSRREEKRWSPSPST